VQCGTPAPDADDFPEDTQFIEVPAGNIISLSTTQLPHLDALNLLDHLVGVDSFDFISNPAVREMIDNGELTAVGQGATINVEAVLDLEPDLVLTSGFDPSTDAHPVLIDSGIFTALNADWREGTPLGRAEWIKYVALFYNAEAQAEGAYNTIVTAYNEAKELAASVPEDERPDVLWNSFSAFSEVWSIPGTETYAGRLIQDAGGVIAPAGLVQAEQNDVAFEVVYDQALDADIWITNLFGVFTQEDLLAVDPRYADFAAFQSGNVWNNNLDVNEFGGQNYFELGVTNPHLILRDLVAIFHPDLLPNHEFVFYRRLEPAE
jgi:iron complex transport system substrate-binding protein